VKIYDERVKKKLRKKEMPKHVSSMKKRAEAVVVSWLDHSRHLNGN
jgi:hypothetical protein